MINEFIKQQLEIESNATPGPWYCVNPIETYSVKKYNHVAHVRGIDIHGPYYSTLCGDEAKFIVESHNNYRRILLALKEAYSGLKTCIGHEPFSGLEPNICSEKIIKIEAILKGEV